MTAAPRIAVVGKGLVGAAAARHLALAGADVLLIGPDEPSRLADHAGVFASHYDQARITRIIDRDPLWARLAAASIARYAEIETASGMRFHHPVGFLACSAGATGLIEAMTRVAAGLAAPISQHPEPTGYVLPAGARTLLETGQAGWINPRLMVRAQTVCALAAGARILRQTVWAMRDAGSGMRLILDDGSDVTVDRVLLCTGAFANLCGLTDGLPLQAQGRVVVRARVAEELLAPLSRLPALIGVHDDDLPESTSGSGTSGSGTSGSGTSGNDAKPDPRTRLDDYYVLPPVRYPDGHHYVKIGSGHWSHPLNSLDAVTAWFHAPDADDDIAALGRRLRMLLPSLEDAALEVDACVLAITPHDRPIIDWIEPGRVAVAGGCCGRSAKSADEIGRLGAALVSAAPPAHGDETADLAACTLAAASGSAGSGSAGSG